MSEQPTHAMLVRAEDGLHLLPACTSRECAERTITFAEGAQVVGVTHLYPEPIPGVQFWSAVQLGNAPKTAADLAVDSSESESEFIEEAHQIAFEIGGTDDGEYHFSPEELEDFATKIRDRFSQLHAHSAAEAQP